jgi:hypothetical protein
MSDKTKRVLAWYALKKSEAVAKEKADRACEEAKRVKSHGLVDIRQFFTPKASRGPATVDPQVVLQASTDAAPMTNDEILEFIADLKNVHGIVEPAAPPAKRTSKFETEGTRVTSPATSLLFGAVRVLLLAHEQRIVLWSQHGQAAHTIMSFCLSPRPYCDAGDAHRAAAAGAAGFAAHGSNKKAKTIMSEVRFHPYPLRAPCMDRHHKARLLVQCR